MFETPQSSSESALKFIKSKYTNLWVRDEGYDVYLRKGSHLHPLTKELIRCLDVANVKAIVPGTGSFVGWISKMEILARNAGFDALHVENVLTERFSNFFRRDTRWIETSANPPSFFLIFRENVFTFK